jgi:hypothetical protein
MRKRYWTRRNKPDSHYLSDYNNPRIIDARYKQPSPFTFIPYQEEPAIIEIPEERVEVRIDCEVAVKGVTCEIEAGSVVTEVLSESVQSFRKVKTIHQQHVAYAPDIGNPSRYGGWVNPFTRIHREGQKPKKKTYTFY